MEYINIILIALLTVLLAFIFFAEKKRRQVLKTFEQEKLRAKQDFELCLESEKLQLKLEHEKEKKALEIELNRANATIANMLEMSKKTEEIVKEIEEKSKMNFENIAGKVLENTSGKLTEKNKENIDTVLKPLGENINEFKKKIEDVQQANREQYGRFDEKIKNLVEQTVSVSKGASDLASALRSQKKMQGDWGEQILENLLQETGLVKGVDYYVQMNVKAEEGSNQRPDFVVKLPNGRTLVIDSKVTLNAYVDYCNDNENKVHLENFIKAVRANIDGLSHRDYEKNVRDSLDFVLMFFPIEGAYMLAVQSDSELLRYAYDKKILLISQSSLLTTLRMVSDMWNREKQDRNIAKIIESVEKLYTKFAGFVEDMSKIGKSIEGTQKNYESAMGKLQSGKGNIIKQASDLNTLGATTKKKLPAALLEQAAEETEYEELT
jgi:DNA recombination protein RmuC